MSRADDPDAYRIQAQVCPRGCEFLELARRELVAVTPRGSWGRAELSAVYEYESSNCPICGARLMRECARCEKPILAPVAERCTWCGLPHPWAAERRSGLAQQPVRKWRKGERDVNDPAKRVYRAARGEVLVVDGDILRLEIDAIISNDDVDGRMWTEIAHAIRVQGGGEIERLARDGAPRPIGQAWTTTGGALPAKTIIHVAAMNRRGESSVKIVGKCLTAALALARRKGMRSVGVATINSGPAAIPLEKWLKMFARICVAHLHGPDAGEGKRLRIVLVLYEPVSFKKTVKQLRGALDAAWRAQRQPADGRVLGTLPEPPPVRWGQRQVERVQRAFGRRHQE